MFTLDGSVVNIAIPTLAREFSCHLRDIEWVIIGYLAVIVVFLLPVAGLATRIGQRRVFAIGLAVFTVGSVLCGSAEGLRSLVAFRLVQASGAVCMAALMSSTVTRVFPKNELGRALGFVTTAATLGTSLGPTIGGFLVSLAGWRAIFYVNIPVGLAAIVLVLASLPKDSSRPTVPRTHPLALLTNTRLLSGLFGRFSTMAANGAYLFLCPVLLETGMGFSTDKSGILLAFTPIIVGVTAPLFGALADRFGSRLFNIAGILAMLAGTATMAGFSADMGVGGFLLRVALWGIGLGMFNSPNNINIMGSVQPHQNSSASALLSLSIMLGQIAGVSSAGALLGLFVAASVPGTPPLSAAPDILAPAIGHSLACFSVLLGAVLLLNLRRPTSIPLPHPLPTT